ncbi:hypothetical protein KP509_21G040700 [Ceratopteris richardii]|uniref:FAS1 domain-containing protein n=1 Tax=Ceratopteris richardii TaxID=49495 RepID=A0A8T2SB92_CERRI|nr:hypothetical protein KP509_21G040700 [Ceratopteris richardii]KAH7315226.1 hypothetical protein KP509_21G040700 [Ceratopteris richardii]
MKIILLSCLSVICLLGATQANNNITEILASHSRYSTFSRVCSEVGVANAIYSRSTITVLVPPNSALDPLVQKYSSSPNTLYAILSLHVLLDYFDTAKFKAITKGTALSATLYQTTGQATGNEGFVNVTVKGDTIHISRADGGKGAIVQNELYKAPYNISVVSIDSVLAPSDVSAPGPAPSPVNLTEILIEAKNYNTFLSLVNSTGVLEILDKQLVPPGITIFAPDDSAFKKLPAGALNQLTSVQKVALLEFHVLGSYYSMQELSTLNSPQDTLASGSGGKYQYKGIFQRKSGLQIDTGYNTVQIGDTLYSQLPLGLYGVSTVLFPTDIFGLPPISAPSPAPTMPPSPAPSPVPTPSLSSSPSPAPSSVPAMAPQSHLFSPPAPPTGSFGSPDATPSDESPISVPVTLSLVIAAVPIVLGVLFH